MSLKPILLDDLDWSQLTKAARDRIASTSRGEWTLHAPVDPGITLLELFAAQLEQRLYWLDQPSESRTAALLKLNGTAIRPVGIAATVMRFRSSEKIGELTQVPAETILKLHDDTRSLGDQPAFSTTDKLLVLPCCEAATQPTRRHGRSTVPQPILELIVGGEDRTLELRANRTPSLLPATGSVRKAEIVFWLNRDKEIGGEISFLLELDVPAKVQPQWMADFEFSTDKATPVAPAAKVSWEYWNGTEFKALGVQNVKDGTNGLRRSGIVRLSIPGEEWKSDPKWGQVPPGAVVKQGSAFRLRLTASQVTFSHTPRVKQIVPNAIIARHLRCRAINSTLLNASEKLRKQVENWRPLSGNVIDLPTDQFGDGPIVRIATAPQMVLELSEVSGFHTWMAVDDLMNSGPGDRHFVVDRESGQLRFGDGLTGRVPIPRRNPVQFQLCYAVGGGVRGNVAGSKMWVAADVNEIQVSGEQSRASSQTCHAINVVPAVGGEEPETVEQASHRAFAAIRHHDRAVTRADIEHLAISTPGVAIARAHAAIGYLAQIPGTPVPGAVTVFVVPGLPGSLHRFMDRAGGDDLVALRPDAGALAAVVAYLQRFRMLTHEIYVACPDYLEVVVHVDIEGVPFDLEQARSAVVESLHQYLHPLFGGPDGNGWPFGGAIRPSELVRQAQQVIDPDLNVQSVGIATLADGTQAACPDCLGSSTGQSNRPTIRGVGAFNSCQDVSLPPHSLVALRAITVAFVDRPPSEQEGIF